MVIERIGWAIGPIEGAEPHLQPACMQSSLVESGSIRAIEASVTMIQLLNQPSKNGWMIQREDFPFTGDCCFAHIGFDLLMIC